MSNQPKQPMFYPSGTITNAGLLRIGAEKSAQPENGWMALVDGAAVGVGYKRRMDAKSAAIQALREKVGARDALAEKLAAAKRVEA